ncbi:MAG: hypothetical protein P4M08_12890 [Oligoflexia bacterium]|nr:hypothetical protein [Oligoflexia bacterium]
MPHRPVDTTNAFIKPSGTGDERAAAKKAPLSARLSAYLGGELTSDALETAATRKRPYPVHKVTASGEQTRPSRELKRK